MGLTCLCWYFSLWKTAGIDLDVNYQ